MILIKCRWWAQMERYDVEVEIESEKKNREKKSIK